MRVWVQPKYPAKVDGETLASAAKNVQPLDINRTPNSLRSTKEIADKNLFRKQRTDYKAPVQIAQATAQVKKTPIPPPELKLKGVILLDGTKIALLEGSYSVLEGENAIKNKPVKRKGYFLGSQVGDYQLTNIEKNLVVLDNSQGGKLELKLADRPTDKVIQRQGNSLIQNNKGFSPKELNAAPPSRRPPPAPENKKDKTNKNQKKGSKDSGSSTNSPNAHISGR